MRVTFVVDGKPEVVDVDLGTSTVTRGGVSLPFKVVSSAGKVELEVAGDRVAVEGWPVGLPEPSGSVSVNGEVVRVELKERSGRQRAAPAVGPEAAGLVGARPTGASPTAPLAGAGGLDVMPPMPGKVIEVRVQDGDSVAVGQVLLVLEAMKMRNEVLAPVAGRVVDLRVAPGANVRAREPMLRIRAA